MDHPWIIVVALAASPFVLAAISWLAAATVARVIARRRILRSLGPSVVPLTARRHVSVLGTGIVLSALAMKAIVATMTVAVAWGFAAAGVVASVAISIRAAIEPGFRIDDEALDQELRSLLDDVA